MCIRCCCCRRIFTISWYGASYPVNAYKQWRQYVQPRVQFAFDSIESTYTPAISPEVDVRNVAQHLANIREVLSPSMSELAKDLG